MGNTLGELLGKFSAAGDETVESDNDTAHEQLLEGDQEKTASDGGNQMADGMGSLASLFMSMTEMDKTAGVIAEELELIEDDDQLTEEDIEKIAMAEAGELVDAEDVDEEPDMMKVAAEYDAAGRIMARGFFDEYIKLASGAMDTSVADNQDTIAPSADSNPSIGRKGIPTLENNYAGTADAGVSAKVTPMNTKGGDQVHINALKESKKIKAGHLGDDPSAAALAGGGTSGFATVKDVMDSNR
ncbi:MAG: hypothetical protein DRP42_00650 [Tenericutes bacterium]|nr:MAG: hypothetical protein DRP42_00650 [Mycoplasmatota bacterium]